jgi:hypothetical protein
MPDDLLGRMFAAISDAPIAHQGSDLDARK